jgi:uncharacterized protein YbjT (DUF2867 family)
VSGRTAIIAGATGLVGQEILKRLLADPSITAVHSLGRRAVAIQNPKLTSHVVDFKQLPALPPADELYLAIGTTIKDAGSQDAFRSVDFDANLAVANAALSAGVKRVGLVSAMGADPKSSVFYSRIKGELESTLAQLPFENLVIARPSMLVGDRNTLGQPERRGEILALKVQKVLGWLIPANYQPIKAEAVATALLAKVPSGTGNTILLSGSMQP